MHGGREIAKLNLHIESYEGYGPPHGCCMEEKQSLCHHSFRKTSKIFHQNVLFI